MRPLVAALDGAAPLPHLTFPAEVTEALEALERWCEERRQAGQACPARTEWLQALLDPGGHLDRRLLGQWGADLAKELAEHRQRLRQSGFVPGGARGSGALRVA